MATNSRDVSLIIRAKDEASKAFEAAAKALEELLSANTEVGASATSAADKLSELVKVAAAIDKAYAQTSTSADKAAAAFSRQNAAIEENKAKLASLQGQANLVTKAIENTRVAIVDLALNGGDTTKLVAQLKGAADATVLLEKEIKVTTDAIKRQETELARHAATMQQVGSTTLAAEAAQAKLRTQIEQTRSQADTEAEVQAVQAKIAAEQEYIAKLKAEQDTQTALLTIEEARRRAASLLPNNGVTGKSARESAGVFQDADIQATRDAERAMRDAAAAEKLAAQDAKAIRAELDPLGAVYDTLSEKLNRYTALRQKGLLTAEQQAAAEEKAFAVAEKAAKALAPVDVQDAYLSKLKAEQDAQSELLRLEEARARAAKLLPGDTTSGKSARESASVFQDADAQAAKAAEKAARDAAAAQDELVAKAQKLRDAVDPLSAVQRKLAADLEELARVAKEAGLSEEQLAAQQERLVASAAKTQAELDGTAQKLRDAAAAEKEMQNAAAALRAQIDPMGEVQRRLNVEMAKAKALLDSNQISTVEYNKALELLRHNADAAANAIGRSAGGKKLELFGLRPYEVQNLGYQINDVFTQLASGTSFSQTMAQQGGQILQIFPKVGEVLIGVFSNPILLAGIAAVGVGITAIVKAVGQAQALREWQGILAASADSAAYSATGLRDAANALDRYRLSAEDAVKIIRTFMKEGLDQSRLVSFGKTAKDMADVLGIDATQAAQKLATALTGGYDSIKKLDDELNFLTLAQRDHIEQLFKEGKAQEAVNEAVAVLQGRYGEAATKMRSEWSNAVTSLANAWDTLLTRLADTAPIIGAVKLLDQLARGMKEAVDYASGTRSAASLDKEIEQLQRQVAVLKEIREKNPSQAAFLGFNDELLKSYEDSLAKVLEQRKALADIEKQSASNGKTQADLINAQGKATKDLNSQTEELLKKNKKASAEERLSAAKAIAEKEAQLELQKEQFKFASQEAQQAYIKAKVDAALATTQADINKDEEARNRELASGITDNRNQSLMATAQRYDGYKETTNKGDLMSFFKDNGVNVDPTMVAWCAAFVNSVLGANGLKGTGSLAAKSFEGYGQDASKNPQKGDIVVLNQGNDPAKGHVGFFQGYDQNGNILVYGGNQGDGQVKTSAFNRDDVTAIRRAPTAGQTAQKEREQQEAAAKKQKEAADTLDRQLETRKLDTEQLRQQIGLTGEALIAKKREQAIEDAVLKAQQDAKKAGTDINSEEFKKKEAEIRQTVGAYYDLANAKAKAEAPLEQADKQVNALKAQRDELTSLIEAEQKRGNASGAEELQKRLDGVNVSLREAIQNSINLWQAVANNPDALAALGKTKTEVEATLLGLRNAIPVSNQLSTQFLMTGRAANEAFAGGAASALDKFAKAVAEGKNVMGSLRDAFLTFASDFLRQIAQMIIKQSVFNAIGGASNSTGSGGFGGTLMSGITSLFTTGIFHDGGIAGAASTTRMADASWFQNAMRYHSGGVAGLAPNEVPAILQRGEEVLTAADPRHSANGGGMMGGSGTGNSGANIKNVIVFDPADAFSQGLNSKVGEKAILNFVQNNKAAFNNAMR